MPRDNSTNPWGDAANQAVGAMYKYYMSQPTAADQAKAQLQQMQLQEMQQKTPLEVDKLRIDNQLNQRMYDSGAYPGMPAPIQNFNFRQNNTSGDATQVFDAYVNPPRNIDLGDANIVQSGVTGLPIQQYDVGIAPERKYDGENRQVVVMPAVPATNRPAMPIANMFGQQYGNADDTVAVNPYQNDIGAVPMNIDDVINTLGGTDDANMMQPVSPEAMNIIDNKQPSPMQPQAVAGPGGMTVTNLPRSAEDIKLEGMKKFSKGIKTNSFNQTVQSAMYNIKEGGAGVGSIVKGIPVVGGQTNAANLEADLNKITSDAALGEIARLKEESKTGGFFGNLSDGERQAVADSQLAIRQNMDPKELAYRLAMHQDLVNDIVYNRGKTDPVTGEVMPLDAGVPRTGLPTIDDVNNAQNIEELTAMWDSFNTIPAFQGQPPKFIEDALIQRVNALRGGQ
jgi:hypothetical protein